MSAGLDWRPRPSARPCSRDAAPGTLVSKGFTVAIVYGVCPKAISHRGTAMKPPTKRGGG